MSGHLPNSNKSLQQNFIYQRNPRQTVMKPVSLNKTSDELKNRNNGIKHLYEDNYEPMSKINRELWALTTRAHKQISLPK
jgi:hypothetical protein